MSSSHHLYELDSATDSVASSPRSEHHASQDGHIRVRFMCSFGGKILPRPHDNQLRYVGGDTRIGNVSVKYQLPNEDLDALISASSIVSEVPDYLFGLENSDEIQPRDPKLRTRQLLHENNSVSDPGSPAPVVSSSPFCSTSSATVVPSVTKPDNPEPVLKSKQSQTDSFVEQPVSQQTTYSGTPMWHHYVPDSHYSAPAVQQIPVYYVPGHVQPGNHQGQAQPVQIRTQYVQQYPNSSGQVPVGYHQQVHGAGQTYGQAPPVDPYDPTWNVAHDEKQPVYYGVRNSGPMQVYPGMVVPGGNELGRSRSDMAQGRISRSGQ
ncbi:hypothetical protein Gotri_006670 [Gossypium trilobum]|uniref:Uncharacterized protein n=1 Tax=Gossypium trilobum TaxID=34281 RepID=A0A7J9F2L7_9ROSI|nr:hypothetical protein [Gossypium trilobum]